MATSATDSKELPYLAAVGAAAPAFAIKALANTPVSAIEYAVERKAEGSGSPLSKLLSSGFRGRASGKLLGGSLGILTAPLYMRGVHLLSTNNKEDRKKGLGYIAAASGLYAGGKGLLEDTFEARTEGSTFRKALGSGGRMAASRATTAIPVSLLLGASIAKGRKKSEDSGRVLDKYVSPALAGAAMGAMLNAGDRSIKDMLSGVSARAIKPRILPRALSGAVGGLLGGAITAGVTDLAANAMSRRKEKTAGALGEVADFGFGKLKDLGKGLLNTSTAAHGKLVDTAATGMQLADSGIQGMGGLVANGVMNLPDVFALHTIMRPFFGIKGRFIGKNGPAMVRATPGLRNIATAVDNMRARELAVGIREGIAGRNSMGIRAKLHHNIIAAEARIERELGRQVGQVMRGVPEAKRADLLRRFSKFVEINPQLKETASGNRSVFATIPTAIDMAVGDRPMMVRGGRVRNALNTGYEKLLYGGRGVLGKGLPTAGKIDSANSRFRNVLEELPALGVAAAIKPVAAPLAAHVTFNTVKSLIASTPAMQAVGARIGRE